MYHYSVCVCVFACVSTSHVYDAHLFEGYFKSTLFVSLALCAYTLWRADAAGEPLCLISSSVESGAELLKVQYFKVSTQAALLYSDTGY